MTNIIKIILAVIAFTSLTQGCRRPAYTSARYFDCIESRFDISKTDTAQIIYQTLLHACVEEKDIPDFSLLKDKQKIYVANILFKSSLSSQDTTNYSQFRNLKTIPSKIEKVRFCLKSFDDLRHIADKAGSFVYIQLGHITISGDSAAIGISTNWMLPRNSKRLMLSGGGYVAKFQKKKDNWTFVGTEGSWIS